MKDKVYLYDGKENSKIMRYFKTLMNSHVIKAEKGSQRRINRKMVYKLS